MSLDNRYTVPETQTETITIQAPGVIDSGSIKRYEELTEQIGLLSERIKDLNAKRKLLTEEQRAIKWSRSKRQRREILLYALRLEDGYWYIGASAYPVKRFLKHKAGKGAKWTRLHRPMELVETRPTGQYHLDKTSLLEDDMTVEYALKYGSDSVRGGGRCQARPKWPSEVIDNERQRF